KYSLIALAATLALAAPAAAQVKLNGAGATFPTIIYQDWMLSYNKAHPDVQLNYQSIGSGGGIRQFSDGTVDFGASDAPMSDSGVTATVRQTPGAAGYVELRYAMINKLPAGAVRNKAGKFITPALESVTAAAAGAMTAMDPNTDFRVSITNPDGDKAYPIASFTWFLIHKQYDDPAKAGALVKFVWW